MGPKRSSEIPLRAEARLRAGLQRHFRAANSPRIDRFSHADHHGERRFRPGRAGPLRRQCVRAQRLGAYDGARKLTTGLIRDFAPAFPGARRGTGYSRSALHGGSRPGADGRSAFRRGTIALRFMASTWDTHPGREYNVLVADQLAQIMRLFLRAFPAIG